MFAVSSLLESRNCLLHLRTILGWKRIQKKVSQTKTGCTLYPALRDQERALSWCSTRQNRRTERVPYCLECVEEMLQESWLSRWTFHRYSRSISQRSSLSWITSRNRMDRRKVQRDGRTCKRKAHVSSPCRGISKIRRTMVSHLVQVRRKWAHEISTRFSSCCLIKKPHPQRVRRTSCKTHFSTTIQEMASFFKHFVVGQVWMGLEVSS